MMQYHWGYGIGHLYAFTSDLGQDNCQQLVGDNDGDIVNSEGEKSLVTAEVNDGSSDDLESLSWSDDGKLQNGNISGVDCEDSDEESQYSVDAMYDLDSQESSWDREYSF